MRPNKRIKLSNNVSNKDISITNEYIILNNNIEAITNNIELLNNNIETINNNIEVLTNNIDILNNIESYNLCLECGIDMGPQNISQLCGKIYCCNNL